MALQGGALGVTALLAAAQLGSGLKQPPKAWPPPDFLACEDENPCNPEGRSVYMGQALRSAYAKAQAVAKTGRKPMVVGVGADGLRNHAPWTDVHLYNTVIQNAGVLPAQLRMAFVEPMEEKAGDFWANIGRLPLNQSQVQLITAMIDGECETGNRTMYGISPRAGHDFHFPPEVTEGWTSTSEEHPFRCLRGFNRERHFIKCPGSESNCAENLRTFAAAANRSSYLVQRRVPCLTLKELLRSVGADASDVVMLVVDAEKSDAAIVSSMLDDPALEPGFVMFEKSIAFPRPELIFKLRARGYLVGGKTGFNSSIQQGDAQNFVAVRPQSLM